MKAYKGFNRHEDGTLWCRDFQDGRAKVKLDGKYNYINTDGKLLYENWFEEAGGRCDLTFLVSYYI